MYFGQHMVGSSHDITDPWHRGSLFTGLVGPLVAMQGDQGVRKSQKKHINTTGVVRVGSLQACDRGKAS